MSPYCADPEERSSLPMPAANETLRPVSMPYHRNVVAHLQAAEPGLWHWFASTRKRLEEADAVRLDLLKSTYRLEPQAQPKLYDLANAVRERTGSPAPSPCIRPNGNRLERRSRLYAGRGSRDLGGRFALLGKSFHASARLDRDFAVWPCGNRLGGRRPARDAQRFSAEVRRRRKNRLQCRAGEGAARRREG